MCFEIFFMHQLSQIFKKNKNFLDASRQGIPHFLDSRLMIAHPPRFIPFVE